jgi:CBS domain-containing protein/anti-sigma regulatory factor (Ser/Thr protein kinase)
MDSPSKKKGIVINDRVAEDITRTEELAYELKVNEVMTHNVQAVPPDMPMGEVVEVFRQRRFSGAPVAVDGTPIGIVSMEDLIRAITKGDIAAPVRTYMTLNPFTVHATDPVVEALKVFVNSQVGRLPVVDEQGKLIGILTKGDITRGFLRALQHDYQEEEVRIYRASHLFEDIESDRTSLILRYNIKVRDFNRGGAASAAIKRALLRLGASPLIARRCGIAAYEAEMNLIIHTTNGGTLRVEIEPHRITMDAVDDGPGIKDVEMAMKPGYSTASEEIRELGFGAGMGLVNISRCVDNMVLESQIDKGTRLKMKIFLEKSETVGEGHSGK